MWENASGQGDHSCKGRPSDQSPEAGLSTRRLELDVGTGLWDLG